MSVIVRLVLALGLSFPPVDFDLASTSSPGNATTARLGALTQPTSPAGITLMDIYDEHNNNNNNNNNNQLTRLDIISNNQHDQYQHQQHPHHQSNHHRPSSLQFLQQQQQQQQQHQPQNHLATAAGMCKCELSQDPQTCMVQCGADDMTTLAMTIPGQAATKPSTTLIGLTSSPDDLGQMTTSPSFATLSTTMITSPSPSSSSSSTTATSATSLSAISTSLGPTTGKMSPLDVTFLLYTRYHRDLAQELAHLNSHLIALVPTAVSAPAASSTATPSSASSSQHQQNHQYHQHHHHHHHHTSVSSSGGGQVSASDILDLTNEATLDESHLNSSLPIKIIIHGFGSGGRRPWVTDMVYKLLDYEDVNVIVVDWEKGAALPNYVQAAGNTRIVGHKIAQLIKSINAKYGLTGNQYHLIGFSLGAHVAGFAGMEIRNSTNMARRWINRITGLDPASPLFEGYDANDRLDPSDAQFVDVIHSNGDGVLRGGFGSLQPMGHVDFYPNGGRVQVGCNSVILSALSDIIYGKWQSLCNHRRALNFFMDSFEFSKCRFRSFNCDSYESYLRGECFDCGPNDEKCSYMGYLANYSEGRGKMYLSTHEEAPFCANQFIIKIVGSKGYKTHWGKVEVTLVTGDGKNESFWLSSMGSTGGASNTGGAASGQSAQSLSSTPSMSSVSSVSPSPSSIGPATLSSTSPSIGQYGAESSPSSTSASNPTTSSATSPSSSRDHLNQQNMQSLIVAHPNLVNFTQIILRYTKYKGWIYSGDESWPIDKVFITDSDGQVKSFCGHNTVLESHITTRLNLEPGNCSVIEPMTLANSGVGGGGTSLLGPASASQVLMNSQQVVGGNPHSRTSVVGGGGSNGGIPGQTGLVGPANQPVGNQQQQPQQPVSQQQSVSSINAQQQQQQSLAVLQQSQQSSSARTPRLLASIMQSAVGAGPTGGAGTEQQQQQHQSGMTMRGHAAAMQRMLSPQQQQHQQQFTLSSGGSGGSSVGGTLGLGGMHQAALSHQIMAF